MRKGLTRVGTGLLALGLAAAATTCRKENGDHGGTAGGGSGASVCATPCNQIIVVGADGALSCADATIQLGAHEVAWRTSSATAKLNIVFDAPSPFPSLRCQGGMCFSGPADPNALPPGTNSKTFGYTSTAAEPEEAKTAQASGGGQPASMATGATPTPTPTSKSTLGRIIIQR